MFYNIIRVSTRYKKIEKHLKFKSFFINLEKHFNILELYLNEYFGSEYTVYEYILLINIYAYVRFLSQINILYICIKLFEVMSMERFAFISQYLLFIFTVSLNVYFEHIV